MFEKEKIIEEKRCKTCNLLFQIYEKDKEMLIKLSPIFSGKKYILPLPIDCPKCRRQKRLAWRNTSKLYRRKCNFSNENIISFYDETVSHPVYDINIWNSDKWNPFDFGKEFDFSKSFFDQFKELKDLVPHFSRSITNLENSDYCNNVSNLKNCYLCFNGGESEDCYHNVIFKDSKNCVDCLSIDLSENCYECIDCYNCNKLFFSQNSIDCSDSYFLKNCNNCKNCFGCKNLVNQEYCIFNKKVEKDNYEIEIKKLLRNNELEFVKNKFYNFSIKLPEKFIHGVNYENVVGDYIKNSKDIFYSFDIIDSENLRYCGNIKEKSRDLMDLDIFGWRIESCYNSVVIGHESSNIFFCFDCWENVNNLYYCSSCIRNISNCFGCIGLHDGKEYCILNKQYTKEEYEKLVPKIIEHMISFPSPFGRGGRGEGGEWGNFLHQSLSSFGYNQTEGILKDLMTKEEALQKGFNWSDYEAPFPKVEKTIPAEKLPKNIDDVPDDILNWAIECEKTGKPFRIIKQELEFYRKHNLEIPRRHPELRYLERVNMRNGKKLLDKTCDKCFKIIKTTYSKENGEIIYCENCYEKEVY